MDIIQNKIKQDTRDARQMIEALQNRHTALEKQRLETEGDVDKVNNVIKALPEMTLHTRWKSIVPCGSLIYLPATNIHSEFLLNLQDYKILATPSQTTIYLETTLKSLNQQLADVIEEQKQIEERFQILKEVTLSAEVFSQSEVGVAFCQEEGVEIIEYEPCNVKPETKSRTARCTNSDERQEYIVNKLKEMHLSENNDK